MSKVKKFPFFIAIFFAFFSLNNVYALTKKQREYVKNNCEKIKETLKGIQRTDSYTRTYLGSVYNEILNNYIIPMNVRLLKNNMENEVLKKNQEDFIAKRQDYNSDFIIYSRSLEDLLNIDCENHPNDFYEHLEVVRIKREIVDSDTKEIDLLISKQQKYFDSSKEGNNEKQE